MTDKTDFHALVALAINFDDACNLELACHPYEGFSLGGEPITEPDLLHVARNSNVLTDQLRHIICRTTEMLEHVERTTALDSKEV